MPVPHHVRTEVKGGAAVYRWWLLKLAGCGRHLDTRTFPELEAVGQTLVGITDDAKEGVTAKLQKRQAKFEGK